MSYRVLALLTLSAILTIAVVACNQETEPESITGAGAQAVTDGSGDSGAGQSADAQPDAVTTEPTPEGMISSGQVEPLPETSATEPVRPTAEEGVQRFVTLDDARAAVPFALHEPSALPEESNLTIVQLVEPLEGETVPGLPAARLVYDIDLEGVLVVRQSPATGEPGMGESATIGAYEGWIDETQTDGQSTTILVWEQDGVRFDVRGRNLDRDTLVSIAASMAPAEAGGE